MIIYVLGSDIPHHNLTILHFFDEVLAKQLHKMDKFTFWLVTGEVAALKHFEHLDITSFSDKKSLAQAVKQQAKLRPKQRFFFHGQFNPYIWLALLSGSIKRNQFLWHIWGADLYEESTHWRHRLFYLVRRLAQRRIGQVFGTQGDLAYLTERLPHLPTSLLYFPTHMPLIKNKRTRYGLGQQTLTILLGNSGDRSNRHLEALHQIATQFGTAVKLVIPLGYPLNNEQYIQQIQQTAQQLFSVEQLTYLTDPIDFNDYLQLIRTCHLGYFIFQRQQGIGTLCLLLGENIPFILNRHNPFWHDLAQQSVPFLFDEDPLSLALITEVQHQLNRLDKQNLVFCNPNYVAGWNTVLQKLMREET